MPLSRFCPSFRAVVGSGLRSCVSWSVRPSNRAFSGRVVVLVFPSRLAAAAFARRWAVALAVGVAVRPAAGGFAVSVPVLGVA